MTLLEFLRSSWFLIAFIGGVVYWAARQDISVGTMPQLETRITSLENRTTMLETGIGKIQIKIDDIKEDLTLIKGTVIKKKRQTINVENNFFLCYACARRRKKG